MRKVVVMCVIALLLQACDARRDITIEANNSAVDGIGRPATYDEVKTWGSAVLTNGDGLPQGRGAPAQGAVVFRRECASCHGSRGQGNDPIGPQLVGGVGTLRTKSPVLTVGSYWPYATTVWDFIYKAMPYTKPGSLSVDETYAVTAYLLAMNGIIGHDVVMDRTTLPAVRMPNRDGFVSDARPDVGQLRQPKPAPSHVSMKNRSGQNGDPDKERQLGDTMESYTRLLY